MNKNKLLQILGDGNIVIPLYILREFKKLNLQMDEFVFLMYLYNKENNIDFNPEKIAKELNMDIMEVMGYVAILADKGYISLDVKKSDNDVLEEVINLSNFYDKISTLIIIFEFIEKKLGRTMNSLEISTVNAWLGNKISMDLIKEAFRIAHENGVTSIKYVDKLILDWVKSGIKTIDDLKSLEKKEIEDNSLDLEIGEWNWLDDEEEYITN